MVLDTQTITRSRTYVLVHGAWHTGNAWQQVRALLESLGHRVYTPHLAGRDGMGRAGITLKDYVAAVVEVFLEHDLREALLVGHSMAGPIIAKAAELVPERIAQLIFHDALLPATGQTLADLLPNLAEQMLPLAEAEVCPHGGNASRPSGLTPGGQERTRFA